MSQTTPDEFLYFDTDGIDSLYNQIGRARLETMVSEKNMSRERSGALKAKLGIGRVLEAFGIPSANVSAELARKSTHDQKYTESHSISREHRLQRVIESLGGEAAIRCNLERAWLRSMERGSAYCSITAEFRPQRMEQDWVEVANSSKFIKLVSCGSEQFSMGMTLGKILGFADARFKRPSHLALRLTNGANLRVFGKMDKARYIKPFTVAWA